MTTPKFEHSEIEEMLENFKSKDWDFMLQSQKKLYAHSPQIISQLLEEVKCERRYNHSWSKGSPCLNQEFDNIYAILEGMRK